MINLDSSHPILFSLRRATAERHAVIDDLLRIDTCVDRLRYRKILAAFDGFFDVWEPRIQAVLPAPRSEWFVARSRRTFLKKDVAALGAHPFALTADSAGRLQFCGASAAFGSMYVLEGSALGGLVIADRVAHALDITPGNGGAFFAGWGSDTARRWREFRQVLESEVDAVPESVDQACRAAVETFDALIETFARALDVDPT